MRTRDHRLDLLKGVLIAGVVLGHFLETSGGAPPDGLYSGWDAEPQRAVLTFLYLFHMPLFVLLAGITARSRAMAHRIAQMVGLYAVLQVTYRLLREQPLTPENLVHPVYGMWFLLAMGWWIASLPLVHRLGRAALPVAVATSLAAVTLPVGDPDLLGWSRAACYWPFFVAGQLYGKELLRRTAGLPAAVLVPAGTVLVAATGLALGTGLRPEWYRGADVAATMDADPLWSVVVRAACLATAVVMSLAVLSIVPRRLPVAEVLGRRSLAVYALHVPVVFVAQAWFEDAGLGVAAASAVAVGLTAVVLAVLAHPVFDRAVRTTATTVADVVVPPPVEPADDAPRAMPRARAQAHQPHAHVGIRW